VVAPIAAIGAIAPISATSSVAAPTSVAATTGAASTGGASFATALGNGLDAVAGAQQQADSLAVQASTGALVDPAQYTIAATQAQLMTQLATTIESKAVAAFNTVMGMQA
jgi:flagellar hook-basal body complex protein FliE